MRIFLLIVTCCTIIFGGTGCSSPTVPASAPVVPGPAASNHAVPIPYPSTFLPDAAPKDNLTADPEAIAPVQDTAPNLAKQIIGSWDFYAFRKKGTNDPTQAAAAHARHRLTFTASSITWVEGTTASTRGYTWISPGRIQLSRVIEPVTANNRQQPEARQYPETMLDLKIVADGSLTLASNRDDGLDDMQMFYRKVR